MIDLDRIMPEKLKEVLGDEQARAYLYLGITAVLAVLYLTFVIIPKSTELSRTSGMVNELCGKIDRVNSRVKRLGVMTRKLGGLRVEMEGYSRALPGETEIPEFLEELSATARASRVKILSITPSEREGAENGNGYYRELPVLVTAKSGYHQLGNFISDLEKGKRFVTIEDLRIRYNSRSPRAHDVKLVLKVYVSVAEEKK